MTNKRLDAGITGVTAVLTACLGCTSLEDLSSYSAGSADAAPPLDLQPGEDDGGAEPVTRTPDAGAPAPAAVEAQSPADVPLVPAESVAAGEDCTAPDEFTDPAATSCYRLDDTATSWRDARALCQDWGGDLAKVESGEENTLLSEHTARDTWLGATDFQDEGTFRWIDGDEVDPDGFWGPAQPDNFEGRENCMELRESDDNWNDVPCMSPKGVLCERPLGASEAL